MTLKETVPKLERQTKPETSPPENLNIINAALLPPVCLYGFCFELRRAKSPPPLFCVLHVLLFSCFQYHIPLLKCAQPHTGGKPKRLERSSLVTKSRSLALRCAKRGIFVHAQSSCPESSDPPSCFLLCAAVSFSEFHCVFLSDTNM